MIIKSNGLVIFIYYKLKKNVLAHKINLHTLTKVSFVQNIVSDITLANLDKLDCALTLFFSDQGL